MGMAKINVGTDFSDDPSGRFYTDGKGSGEEFREEYLWPKLQDLQSDEKLTIIMDDHVEGYGSSFLVEGFAGIVKFGYMKADQLIKLLDFKYQDDDFEFYKERCIKYIEEAKFSTKDYQSTKSS
jgi:hypothetical protein